MRNLRVGAQGERFAVKYLKKRGYKILGLNYRCHLGEIDIVASHKSVLVFIEVKTRSSDKFGPPQLAVTAAKQKKLAQLAMFYLIEQGINNQDCRFDVVAVRLDSRGKLVNIEIIQNAFALADY